MLAALAPCAAQELQAPLSPAGPIPAQGAPPPGFPISQPGTTPILPEGLRGPSDYTTAPSTPGGQPDPAAATVPTTVTSPPIGAAPPAEDDEDDEDGPLARFSPERLLSPLARLPGTMYGFTVADSWRGLPDGHFQNNNGFKKGVNVARLVPYLEQWGIAGQLGGSYGLYHTTGRYSTPDVASRLEQQAFVTGGLFRRATVELPIAAGFVYDGMINNGYGEYSQSPYLTQFRFQVSWCLNDRDELGFWMTQHGSGVTHYPDGLVTSWRAINQYNWFWHHHYKRSGASLITWIGMPEHHRLDGDGSLGQLIMGSYGSMPINKNLSLYGNCAYMMPSARPSVIGSTEESFYVGFGLLAYIKPNARKATVRSNPDEPYFGVADNSNFFVDTTRSY